METLPIWLLLAGSVCFGLSMRYQFLALRKVCDAQQERLAGVESVIVPQAVKVIRQADKMSHELQHASPDYRKERFRLIGALKEFNFGKGEIQHVV